MLSSKPFSINRQETSSKVEDIDYTVHQLWDWRNKTDRTVANLDRLYNRDVKVSDILSFIKDAQTIAPVILASTSTELTKDDEFVLCNTTGGTFSVTLPGVGATSGHVSGHHLHIIKVDGSSNAVSVSGAVSGETIKDDPVMYIRSQWSAAHLVAGNGKWYVI